MTTSKKMEDYLKKEKRKKRKTTQNKWKTNQSTKINLIGCHSQTQPQLELELDLIMGRNPPQPGTFKALPDNLGS
jgi:hypothetical protein